MASRVGYIRFKLLMFKRPRCGDFLSAARRNVQRFFFLNFRVISAARSLMIIISCEVLAMDPTVQ